MLSVESVFILAFPPIKVLIEILNWGRCGGGFPIILNPKKSSQKGTFEIRFCNNS